MKSFKELSSLEEDARSTLQDYNEKRRKERIRALRFVNNNTKLNRDKLANNNINHKEDKRRMDDVIEDMNERSLAIIADMTNFIKEYGEKFNNLKPSLEKIILSTKELRRKLPK